MITSIGRVMAIATNVFREVIRERVLYLVGFYIFLMTLALWLLPEVSTGSEDKILTDLGLAAIGVLSLLVAVFSGSNMVNQDIEKRTVYLLIAKPLSRAEFVLGKHLGLVGVLALLVATMGGLYLGILTWDQVEFPLGSILVALTYMFLQLVLMAAVSILFSTFSSALMATLVSLAVYLIGQFSRDLVTFARLVPNEGFQRMTRGLYLFLPDLGRLNLNNEAVYGILPTAATLWLNAGYALLYVMVLLATATFIFSRREF